MEIFENALMFLTEQAGKTNPGSFSPPASRHLKTIRDITQRAEEFPDQFSAASMGNLAQACSEFILARRRNAKPVSFRSLVLMDAAYAMVESIAERASQNGHMPTKHQLKIDRAMKQISESLPDWPQRGTFFRLDLALKAANGVGTSIVARLNDAEFQTVEHMRYMGSVTLSDAAKNNDFVELMQSAKNIFPIENAAAEPFRLVAYYVTEAAGAVLRMEQSVASPLPKNLQRAELQLPPVVLLEIKPSWRRRAA